MTEATPKGGAEPASVGGDRRPWYRQPRWQLPVGGGLAAVVVAIVLVATLGSSSTPSANTAARHGVRSTGGSGGTSSTSSSGSSGNSSGASSPSSGSTGSSSGSSGSAGSGGSSGSSDSGGSSSSPAAGTSFAIPLPLGAADTQTPPGTLDGAGANSIEPFFAKVFYEYSQSNKALTVNFNPAGSSVGVSDIEADTVAFGDSEIPVSTPATGADGNILQIPVDLGGVAISYNLPGAPAGLQLDGSVLAGIFDGTYTTWQQVASAGVSGIPSSDLGLPVVPVHRSDSAGPSWDLDQYLIDTSPTWVSKIGTSTASKTWPEAKVGLAGDLNTGVASDIEQTTGAIGYVEYAYSLQGDFTDASVLNAAGSYVAPTTTTIANAGAQAASLSASNFDIVNGPGADTYPLANFSWTLIYQEQSNVDTGIELGRLFDWVVTTGQQYSTALGYASLPANVVSLAESTLEQLETTSGQPLFTS